jgi:hypothetical protein
MQRVSFWRNISHDRTLELGWDLELMERLTRITCNQVSQQHQGKRKEPDDAYQRFT